MSFYNPKKVIFSIKSQLLFLLLQCDSCFVVQKILDAVFWNLLVQSYPLEESYRWLSKSEKIPIDLYQEKDHYFDRRRLCYWFWNELCKLDYGLPQQRVANGTRTGHLIDNIVAELTALPFLNALHTWFATCELYLQVCNIDWYLDLYQQNPQSLRIWEPGNEREISNYLTGMMALKYS